jgi:hypothetical protein
MGPGHQGGRPIRRLKATTEDIAPRQHADRTDLEQRDILHDRRGEPQGSPLSFGHHAATALEDSRMQTNKLKTMVALLALSACVPLAIAQQGQLPAGGGKQGATAFKEGAGGDKKGAMAFKEGGDTGGDKKGSLMV